METLVHQIYAFSATIVIGMAAGFCYDYYRVMRGVFRLKKVGTFLGDMLFWLITTAVVFLMLLRGNWGEVRLYVFVGLGMGALIYFHLLSGPVSRLVRFKFFLFQKTWELFVKTVMFLWMVVLFPLRLLIFILSYPLDILRGFLMKTGQKLRVAFYNLAGKKVKRGVAGINSRLVRLVFWKKKKD